MLALVNIAMMMILERVHAEAVETLSGLDWFGTDLEWELVETSLDAAFDPYFDWSYAVALAVDDLAEISETLYTVVNYIMYLN